MGHALHLLRQQSADPFALGLRALHDELVVDLEHQPGGTRIIASLMMSAAVP